jgi:hypothetical protein
MVNLDPSDILKYIPPEIGASVRKHGFSKMAAFMRDLPDLSERSVLTHLGTQLMLKQAQWKKINRGIQVLKQLGD